MQKHSVLFSAACALTVSLALGCGSSDANRPDASAAEPPAPPFLDGLYGVRVSERQVSCSDADGNTVYETEAGTDRLFRLDLLAHPRDGLYELTSDFPDLPRLQPFAISEDGVVEETQTVDGADVMVVGAFHTNDHGREVFELQLQSSAALSDGTLCTITSVLNGWQRKVASPTALDGLYETVVDVGRANTCPISDAVVGTKMVQIDVFQTGEGGFLLTGEDFAVPTQVDDAGTLTGEASETGYVGHGVIGTFTTRADGYLLANDGQVTMDRFSLNATGVECGQRATLHMQKRVPNPALPQNDYRVETVINAEGCGFDAETVHDTVRIMPDNLGTLTLRDGSFPKGVTIALDGTGYFKTVLDTLALDGRDLFIEGTVANGVITYATTLRDSDCNATIASDGVIRYVPLPSLE